MGAVNELSSAQLRYLTEIDHVNHMAWIAVDPQVAGEPGLGVARYVRLEPDPTVAASSAPPCDIADRRSSWMCRCPKTLTICPIRRRAVCSRRWRGN